MNKEIKESTIRKVLRNEFTILITIVGFLGAGFAAYWDIKTNLALIKYDVSMIRNNELVHVAGSFEKLEARNGLQDERTIELGKQIERILTKLEYIEN